jgi:hypothetical protein
MKKPPVLFLRSGVEELAFSKPALAICSMNGRQKKIIHNLLFPILQRWAGSGISEKAAPDLHRGHGQDFLKSEDSPSRRPDSLGGESIISQNLPAKIPARLRPAAYRQTY